MLRHNAKHEPGKLLIMRILGPSTRAQREKMAATKRQMKTVSKPSGAPSYCSRHNAIRLSTCRRNPAAFDIAVILVHRLQWALVQRFSPPATPTETGTVRGINVQFALNPGTSLRNGPSLSTPLLQCLPHLESALGS